MTHSGKHIYIYDIKGSGQFEVLAEHSTAMQAISPVPTNVPTLPLSCYCLEMVKGKGRDVAKHVDSRKPFPMHDNTREEEAF